MSKWVNPVRLGVWGVVLVVCVCVGVGSVVLCRCVCVWPVDLFTDTCWTLFWFQFRLVDLAGSERAKKTGAAGQRFKEVRPPPIYTYDSQALEETRCVNTLRFSDIYVYVYPYDQDI